LKPHPQTRPGKGRAMKKAKGGALQLCCCNAGAAVIAVIFEVAPKENPMTFLSGLRSICEPNSKKVDGFISVEQLESLTEPVLAARAPEKTSQSAAAQLLDILSLSTS
jgi:hypothetical protein